MVLLITVAESHPVKVKELVNIINSFPGNVGQNITEKLLVFVTHKSGALKNVQPLHTAKNLLYTSSIPDAVAGFEQYVYRHKI